MENFISERDKFDGRYDDDEVEDEKKKTAVARERAKQAKADAARKKSNAEEVDMEEEFKVTVDVDNGLNPYETTIVANYPNPFNPTTTIEFDLAKAGFVDVTVYDLQGRKVVNLFNGNLDKSQGYTFNWDASSVASGQYFARITAPGFSDVINMTLLK